MNIEKFYNGCDKVMRVCFYALIYFLPISVALVEIFTTVALLAFFAKRGARFFVALKAGPRRSVSSIVKLFLLSYKPVSSAVNVPIACFILVNFISVLCSQYVCMSFQGFFYKLLQSTFIVFTFLEAMTTVGQLRIFISIFMVSAFVIGSNGIFQYITGKGFIFDHALMDHRVTSSLKHPNDFGTYLVVVLPIIVGLIIYFMKNFLSLSRAKAGSGTRGSFGWQKILLFIFLFPSLAFSLSCLGLTLSRGAWVATFVGMIFFSVQYKKAFPVFVGFAVIFLFVFFPRLEKIRNVSFVSDNVKFQHRDVARMTGEDASFLNYSKSYLKTVSEFEGMGRGGFWREAIEVIRTYPAFGSGLNTYSKVLSETRSGAGGYPHNCFLQMAAEIGIFGLGVFLWLIIACYMNFFKAVAVCKDVFAKDMSFGFMAALTGYLVHSSLDTNLYSVQLGNLFWLLLAVIVALPKASNPR